MKYCTYCGAQAQEDAAFCVHCGRSLAGDARQAQSAAQPQVQVVVQQPARPQHDEALCIIVKVFLILGCIAQGWMLVPLLWCIPLTVSVFNSFRDGRPVSVGTKVCVLLFIHMIAGICLLCMNDNA